MSAFPGKVVIDGVAHIGGEKVFALQFLQARNPDWVRKPFYARYDANATWMDELQPAFGKEKFFFEEQGGSRSEPLPDYTPRKVIPLRRADAASCSNAGSGSGCAAGADADLPHSA
jgi:hypothetical protein